MKSEAAKDWYTLPEIVQALDGKLDPEAVSRIHDNFEVQEVLGASGDEYPGWSLRYWRAIAAKIDEGYMDPDDVDVFLKMLIDEESEDEEEDDDLAPAEGVDGAAGISVKMVEKFAEVLAAALVRGFEELYPPPIPEDRLVGKEEAARILNCTPNMVSRRIRPILPGSWSHLQIQEYLASLRAQNVLAPPKGAHRKK